MRRALFLFAFLCPLPLQAEPQLPKPAMLAAAASPEFLAILSRANVAALDCPGFESTEGEWDLITQTADAVAAQLVVSPEAYESDYLAPAFQTVLAEGGCAAEGPKVAETLAVLAAMGGRAEGWPAP